MRLWYFFIALPFCMIGLYCTFGAIVTGLDRNDLQRRQTLKVLLIAGAASWAVTIFLLTL
ncbi:hypothetical protein FNH09_40575 [Streptomyces adustus]|uniref:Uncharacterized protein n=1 Tax=Streptomyces adustus TaxID=1609272 RepID=A0A5N8VR63_9ACTN|nr:hypothetical protein [Streptomyces adustus]MPY37282.1 hypothetical protein [Streptomyces adustus]